MTNCPSPASASPACVASHRTGPRVDETLARAGISRYNLPAGYLRLVEGATAAIAAVRNLISVG
jgi:hypothetical protein